MITVATGTVDEFEASWGRMFSVAYRLLGSATDAEDVVQDAFLRWHRADHDLIRSVPHWLVRVVTNLALNRLGSAAVRREQYVGPWLPEPVLTVDGQLGPMESAEQRESVSLALLIMMERLSPIERAVYVLREAFDYSHREIAEILDESEANSRQILRRSLASLMKKFGSGIEVLRVQVNGAPAVVGIDNGEVRGVFCPEVAGAFLRV